MIAREKILIVEDNKALSKLIIIKKMEASLDFDVDAAYTFEEAKSLVEKNSDYFVALLDLNLPDAPDGEVVDLILSYKIPSIILTGTMDQEIREKILLLLESLAPLSLLIFAHLLCPDIGPPENKDGGQYRIRTYDLWYVRPAL